MRLGDVSIPALGPQTLPLSNSQHFGIALNDSLDAEVINNPELSSLRGWTRCYEKRETWLYLSTTVSKKSIELSAKAIGNEQLRMVFYIQAKKCIMADGTLFLPGELRSYEGAQNCVIFDQTARFRSKEKSKLQLIPLSGDDCFWNANFLLSFEFSKSRSLFDIINLVLD